MQLFYLFLNEILVIEVDVKDGHTSIQMKTAKYQMKNKEIILLEVADIDELWSKTKPGVAVLFVSGSDVGSRIYIPNDDASTKIIENENLFWSIHERNNASIIDFIRKASLESILDDLEKKGVYVADILISKRTDINIPEKVLHLYDEKLNFNLVKKSKEFRAFFFESLFNKIKLPILLIFLVLLFINYITFSRIKEKYDNIDTSYNIQLQNSKLKSENVKNANRFFGEFNKMPTYSLALVSDRIASYVPKNMQLSMLHVFPEKKSQSINKNEEDFHNIIIVKGKAEIAGTVLLFAQYLEEDKLFNKVDIININNQKDSNLFDFELHIIL